MKDKKILIFKESGKQANFLKDVNEVKDIANSLIELYNSKQPWGRIETITDFESLYSNPLAMFDKTLLANIDISATGGRLPDPKTLAELFKIDRAGFMEEIGQSEPEEDCPGCKKRPQTIKVARIKISAKFYQYAEYLYFINGTFVLNDEAIKLHLDTLNVYAETDEQLKFYNHWVELCEMLNRHDKIHGINISGKQQTASALRVQLSEGMSGKFVINNMALAEQIRYIGK
jgi:hypothetical protein